MRGAKTAKSWGFTNAIHLVIKRRSLLLGEGTDGAQKGFGGIGEGHLAAMNQAEDALHLQFIDRHADQIAGSEFAGDSGGDTKKGQAEEAERLRGYAMGSLAQGMPRDIGQPSAVQVRISNPDKL